MGWPSRNVELGPAVGITSWRKISFGSWRPTGDSSVHALLEFDAQPSLDYLEKLRGAHQQRVTLSHLAIKAIGRTLRDHPEINSIIRLGRLYPRKNADVFLHVASDSQGRDLSGLTVRQADRKSVLDIAKDVEERVTSIRKGQDQSFNTVKSLMSSIPGFFSRLALDLSALILYTFNLWSPALGPRDAFGSAMLTNIGSLELDSAFVPIAPYTRIPIVFALGGVIEQPVIREGKVVPGKVIRLCVTFDHRIIDGVHGSKMARTLRKIFADPEQELS